MADGVLSCNHLISRVYHSDSKLFVVSFLLFTDLLYYEENFLIIKDRKQNRKGGVTVWPSMKPDNIWNILTNMSCA